MINNFNVVNHTNFSSDIFRNTTLSLNYQNKYNLLFTCSPGDDRPDLGGLFTNVIPQYAARWETLGAILGLKDYEIDVITKDYPNRSTEACTAMLMKWLQSVYQPTWGKMDDAINKLLRPRQPSAVPDATGRLL